MTAYHQDFIWVKKSLRNFPISFSKLSTQIPLEITARMEFENPICVHMRFGDFLNSDIKSALGELSASYYNRAMELFEEGASKAPPNQKRPIWIFSDDIKLAKQKLNITDREIVGADGFNLTAAQELALLSMSMVKIVSNSTYSWWAGYLSNDNSVVAAPNPLTINSKDNPARDSRWKSIQADFVN